MTAPNAGTVIAGRYRVQRLLASGGVGSVYEVLDPAVGRKLALKQLHPNTRAAVRQLFEQEYQTLASLRHPGIVEVYDYSPADEGPFYTMELLEGQDLSGSAPVPWQQACAILRDVASILGVLHARQLVHRDLSPRNLWRTRDGRIKLIDFGTLTPFGRAQTVAGTPPFIPPEALLREPLDQRADLFALGALGYWLCTGAHAFHARDLTELKELQRHAPEAAAARAREPLPPVLDDLLLALLSRDPQDRPEHTAELIDRLNALAELPPEAGHAERGYVDSKAFVGRKPECARVARALARLHTAGARTQSFCVEGEAGMGRTRLLRELVLIARLSGAHTVCIEHHDRERPYAAATELLAALRRAGATSQPAPESADMGDVLQQAVLAACRAAPLGLFIDDVDDIDTQSAALLASLALEPGHARLLIVVTLRLTPDATYSAPVLSLRNHARGIRLAALSGAETFALIRSVFGEVPYLERLAERVHAASHGNPAHCQEIVEHLVITGNAVYGEGSWQLPPDLDLTQLPTRREAHLRRLQQLPASARDLARRLSVEAWGELSFAQCCALSTLNDGETRALLQGLCESKILHQSGAGYAFVNQDVQKSLRSELAAHSAAAAHRASGEVLARHAGTDARLQLRAALHLLHAGESRRGLKLLSGVTRSYERRDIVQELRPILPMLEAAHALLTKLELSQDALGDVSALLAVAGYLVDRRYGRYGPQAIALAERALSMDLCRKLQPRLGGKPALLVALAWSAARALSGQGTPGSIKLSITRLIGTASALNALAGTLADVPTAERYAEAIAPFAALGREHVAAFSHDFVRFIARQCSDRLAQHQADAEELRARLEATPPLRGLLPTLKQSYLGGLCTVTTMLGIWREDPATLRNLETLESFGPLHQLYADHGRSTYFTRMGELELAEQYRHRIEVHAVQLDSAWQVEMWGGAIEAINLAILTHDAVGMKRAAQQLNRLCATAPSLALLLRRARGNYCVLRGQYAKAIALLDADEQPMAMCGWAQTRGMLARAHNGLADHARAKAICLDALSHLTDADLEYVTFNLIVQIELAIANAGLGELAAAASALDALIARHAPAHGPLTMGALHHARARVAWGAGDGELARAQVARLSELYRATGSSTLRELVDRLERTIGAESQARADELADMDPSCSARLQAFLSTDPQTGSFTERARACLQLALDVSGATTGFIVSAREPNAGAPYLGDTPPRPTLIHWAQERVQSNLDDDNTVVGPADVANATSSNWESGELTFRFSALICSDGLQPVITGGLVLGFAAPPQAAVPVRVLQAIAAHLLTARAPIPPSR